MEQLEFETERTLGLKGRYRELRIMLHLVRNHFEGILTTRSSLAALSGLSYGTAVRAIANVCKRGLIVRRPRTATGKSFSLHPSTQLLENWQLLARRVKSLPWTVLQPDSPKSPGPETFFYGASYMSVDITRTPPVLDLAPRLERGLRLLVHADPTFMGMHALKRQFELVLGSRIEVHALSIDRLREEILENGSQAVSKYDIIACNLPWFGELAAGRRLLALDEMIASSHFDAFDFHPAAMASARYRGVQYGIPVQTTPELLVYRKDLFADAGLEAPSTIGATLAAARKLHDPFLGMSGIAWNAARGTPLGHTFLMVMGAFGQPVLNLRRTANGFDGENVAGEEMRPMFATPQAKEVAEYLCELARYSPPNILSMSWYERAVAYAEGSVAMAYCYTTLASLFELDKASPAHRQTGYLPHPTNRSATRIAPLGGYALAIPANVAPMRIDSVWTSMRLLASSYAAKRYIENGSVVSPRFSVSRDPEVNAVSPIIQSVDEMARRGYLQMWPRPPVPEISAIIAIAGEEMHDMLCGIKSANGALQAAQNRADALMRSRGHY